MNKLELMVIHCTDTPPDRDVTGEMIRRWHTLPQPKGRGWRQVGYSELFHLDGNKETLVYYDDDDWVDPEEITNGASGYNSRSFHIVYAGGCDKARVPMDTRTPEQKEALKNFVLSFLKKHPTVRVCGHNQLSEKACPSFDVPTWLREIGVADTNIYTI
jgi:N-acetylmuramoyl-L-alanine amidase